MTQTPSQSSQLFELGRLYADKGDFALAISHLNQAASSYFQEKNFTEYLKTLNIQLRIYAEMNLNEEVHKIKARRDGKGKHLQIEESQGKSKAESC